MLYFWLYGRGVQAMISHYIVQNYEQILNYVINMMHDICELKILYSVGA